MSAEPVPRGQCPGSRDTTTAGDRPSETATRPLAEAWLGRVLETIAEAIVIVDTSGNFIFANAAAERLTGLSRDELMRRTVHDWNPALALADGRPVPPEEAVFPRLLGGGLPSRSVERRLYRPDGSWVIVSSNVAPFYDAAGAPAGVVISFADITARTQAEAALREQQAVLQNIIAHIPSAVFWKDRQSTYLGCNQQSARDLGRDSPTDVIGKTDHDMPFTKEEADSYVRCDQEVMASGKPLLNLEETQRRPDGSEAVLLTSKVPLWDATGRVVGVLGLYTDITERKRVLEALRRSEERYRVLVENANDIIYSHDLAGNLHSWNRAGERLLGYTTEEIRRMNIVQLVAPEQLEMARRMTARKLTQGGQTVYELDVIAKDGQRRSLEINSHLESEQGQLVEVHGIARDVTGRKRLEEQLRQAQKMEAVGRLAGGIAHDFNNLMTAVIGYGDLLLADLHSDAPAREYAEQIRRAGERAALLTRQLLAFGRRQLLQPKVLDLNAVAVGLEKILRRVLGEDIDLEVHLAHGLGSVRADPGQMEQVLMNLCLNARDAMPTGGRLTVETRNLDLDAPAAARRGSLRPGRYVVLAVADTGCGMTAEVRAHLFEPFFTTKEVGKGTGLGLATVYGIVEQSGGHIEVASAPGKGSRFEVYLPRLEGVTVALADPSASPRTVQHGSGTVLLAEDEAGVRALCRCVLEGAGYAVLEAACAEEALQLAAGHAAPIDLLVTDVVMPGLGGRELAERLEATHPGVRVLYLSGYTEDAVLRHGVQADQVHFLQKPFAPAALANKAREVIGR